MAGSSLLYAWDQEPWLFLSFMSTSLIMWTLILPLFLALLEFYMEGNLRHSSDTIYDYYSSFFFNQADIPKKPESKVTKFFFSFFILVFMSFYLGILTEEFFIYKNFDGISSVEDIVNRKINIYSSYKYMLLGVGGIHSFYS